MLNINVMWEWKILVFLQYLTPSEFVLQVPLTVHFDHGTSKPELLEMLELVSFFLCKVSSIWPYP